MRHRTGFDWFAVFEKRRPICVGARVRAWGEPVGVLEDARASAPAGRPYSLALLCRVAKKQGLPVPGGHPRLALSGLLLANNISAKPQLLHSLWIQRGL